jgi:predicted GIY-YIG superfamily endonuclease
LDILFKQNHKAIKYIETTYPEYFEGNKLTQKLSKKSDQIVYVSIYELDDYWSKYWKQEVECMVCHKKIPLIQTKNHLGNINIKKFTCSIECENVRKEKADNEIDEYWNDRCQYYFIYKITNKENGMVYIGYTEREPIFRWWEHFKHSYLPIGEALKSYGIEAFTFEVLEKHLKSKKTIEEMHKIETAYINAYDSIKTGYNCIVSKTV